MACLHCNFVGCWTPRPKPKKPSRKRRSQWSPTDGRHIQLHLLCGGHWLAAHLDRLEVFCGRCGDFVYDDDLFPPLRQDIVTDHRRLNSDAIVVSATTVSADLPPLPATTTTTTTTRKKTLLLEPQDDVGIGGWLSKCLRRDVPALWPVPRDLEDAKTRHGLRGICNLGNTCFMSCIVQGLVHLAPLQAYFLDGFPKQALLEGGHDVDEHLKKNMGEQTTFCLACEMCNIFAHMFASDDGAPFIPHRLLYATWRYADRFAGYEQQDAHEFLMVLLDALAKQTKSSIHQTDITNQVFRGDLGSHLECTACGHKKHSVEPFLDLSLALHPTNADNAPIYQESATVFSDDDNKSAQKSDVDVPMETDDDDVDPPKKRAKITSDTESAGGGAHTDSELFTHHSQPPSGRRQRSMSPAPTQQRKGTPPPLQPRSSRAAERKLKLEECLVRFTSSERLCDDHVCENCGKSAARLKRLTIARLPNVLIVHLKRFDAVRSRKIVDGVEFPLTLDLAAHVDTDDAAPHIFHLAGVVNHVGDLARGHYTCFVKEAGAWFSCDDTKVEEVSGDYVLQSEGYILFYIREALACLPSPAKSPSPTQSENAAAKDGGKAGSADDLRSRASDATPPPTVATT